MHIKARVLAPAKHIYRGVITNPDRWATWLPREGDILVCTPSKCGTTWTQTILTMLVHGGPDLPAPVPVLSPWVDADLGVPPEEVAAALAGQSGRRVVKTHTPADGFPVWQGVNVVAVYRHPLDMFFSLRKHTANRRDAGDDHATLGPVSEAIDSFLEGSAEAVDFDKDTLASMVHHFRKTALSGRLPKLGLFHYADMIRDGRAAVKVLARAAGIAADPAVIDAVTAATTFGAMKANPAQYVPVAGTGFWKSDVAFFDSSSSRKWEGQLSEDQLARYHAQLELLLPDAGARNWLEHGGPWNRQAR
ncbi:MAG: sulfotransferase domain-containing protein [bacterium]